MPLLFPRGLSPQLLLIPPFAEDAKDGAPDPSCLAYDQVLEYGLKTRFDTAVYRRAPKKPITLRRAYQELYAF